MRSFALFSLVIWLLAASSLALPELASADALESRTSKLDIESVSGEYESHLELDISPLAAASAKLKAVCPSGTGLCSTGVCCPLGGQCCKKKKCCKKGMWCYGGGCCPVKYNGCDGKGCCKKGWNCCKGGNCCQKGYYCYKSKKYNYKIRCCPIGKTCV